MQRRTFLLGTGAAAAAPAAQPRAAAQAPEIDHRYAPMQWQTAYCFPDDPFKSLVGNRGELLYGHPGRRNPEYFPVTVEFGVLGMESPRAAAQRLEAPGIPIVHTRLERPGAVIELTTFASRREGEGRVDNVLMTVRPAASARIVSPVITITGGGNVRAERAGDAAVIRAGTEKAPVVIVTDRRFGVRDTGRGAMLTGALAQAAGGQLEFFFRFPQEGQRPADLALGVEKGRALLEETRSWWRNWNAFGPGIAYEMPGAYGRFLTACARNILQAREVRNGRITFQVGPTCYRGLWVVDGHFILEAARYLGYDAEIPQGLEATWGYQEPSGALNAGGGPEHWKDAAIAIFSLIRQCELAQDFSAMDRFRPNVERAVAFLASLRERARSEEGPSGRYGLLARGFGDGGLLMRHEFTNTLWTLAGLKALSEMAQARKLGGFDHASRFYSELRAAFDSAAAQEMRRHPRGFDYLPMLMKEDPQWTAANEFDRPKPQVAQWALSQAIYPGVVFGPRDPVVRGHNALMQACTEEDVPVETGWLPHRGLWTYNAAFVAHAYLWSGEKDWARRTFRGFLNHATPLYCWREEQPIRGTAASGYVGDMPHNWASAECVLFLRHMLALEDGQSLRLLEGMGGGELASAAPFAMTGTPTRFGRVNVRFEPARTGEWSLQFERKDGPAPGSLVLPAAIGDLKSAGISGASSRTERGRILLDPSARAFSAVWKRA